MMSWIMKHRQNILTTLGLVVTVVVAGFGAWQSWGHITHVGHMVEEPTAAFTAVSIDGMMFVGGVMGAVDRYRGFKTRWWAIIALWLGSAMSIGANVGSAFERGFWASLWSVVPAVSLLVCVEIMFHPSRRVIEAVKEIMEIAEVAESLAEAPDGSPVQAIAITEILPEAPVEPAVSLPEGFHPAPVIWTGPTELGPKRAPRKRRQASVNAPRGEGTRPHRRLTSVT
jgi:hypothetical protein